MKTISISVPDEKEPFFKELIEQLGFEIQQETMQIPQSHIDLIRERIQLEDQSTWIPVKDLKEQLRFDAK